MATILVVDDRAINRQFLATLLGYGGHRIVEAADGVEALERARAERPQLVITDILMPRMDGVEFTRRMRGDATLAGTTIIFYTATYRVSEARQMAEGCGVRTIIPKPSEPEVLLRLVADALGEPARLPPSVIEPPPLELPQKLSSIGTKLQTYLVRLEELNREMTETIRQVASLAAAHDQMRAIAEKTATSMSDLQTMSLRQAALIEVGLEIATKRDPRELLAMACRATQDILSARFTALGVLANDGESLRHFVTWGLDAGRDGKMAPPSPRQGVLGRLLETGRPIRLTDLAGGAQELGLAPSHQPSHSFLGVPVASSRCSYGWLYFCDKLGDGGFADDDERIAVTLAAQVAVAYENSQLLEEFQRLNTGLEQRVAQRTAELEAANRELESFTYSVAHDLRAPLRGIDGFSRVLLHDQGAQLDPAGRKNLERIRSGAQQMGELIDGLLRLSRTARADLRHVPVDLAALARDALAEIQRGEPARSVAYAIASALPATGDPVLLRAALENLLGNAWKFTSGRPNARIEVGALERDGERVFFVRDNGVGFDPAYAGKLFAPFQRLHTTSEFPGTGIGLATVQRIVRRHGGRVWAEATVNLGATFYFTLGAS